MAPALAAWAIVQLSMPLTASQSLGNFVSCHKLGHFSSKAVDQSQLSINRFQGEHAGIWRTFCSSKYKLVLDHEVAQIAAWLQFWNSSADTVAISR